MTVNRVCKTSKRLSVQERLVVGDWRSLAYRFSEEFDLKTQKKSGITLCLGAP